MKVLVACEESQTVTKEFRKLGHEAYSCDILPCSGGHPEWHIQKDVMEVLDNFLEEKNSKVISFPPCTDLAVSGARWFKQKRDSGQQEKSIKFFYEIWKRSDCVEQPISIMQGGEYLKTHFTELYLEMLDFGFPFSPDQVIQPWQFGHGETKATTLWLNNGLPLLQPTNIVEGREQRIWKMPPSKDRAKLRSKTYQGIAQAMAEQWGK